MGFLAKKNAFLRSRNMTNLKKSKKSYVLGFHNREVMKHARYYRIKN